ncbi:MAG: type II toxin-antitoxin system HicB family antitoxin [Campylobacterales bacterium]
MHYPIAIEPGNETTAYGVIVPDLPGCFSAGETLDEAIENSKEAIALHIDGLLDDGLDVPAPQPIERFRNLPEYQGMIWAAVEIDPTSPDRKAKLRKCGRKITASTKAEYEELEGTINDGL